MDNACRHEQRRQHVTLRNQIIPFEPPRRTMQVGFFGAAGILQSCALAITAG